MKAIKAHGSVTGSQFASQLSAFALTLVLARDLGPEDFGIFSLYVAAIGVAVPFSELGVFSAVARLSAREDDAAQRARVLGGGAVIAGALGLGFTTLGAVAGAVITLSSDSALGPALLVSSPLVAGLALELSLLYLCQGTGRHDLIVARNLLSRPLSLLLVGIAIAGNFSTVTIACVAYAAGPAVAAVWVLRSLPLDFSGLRESRATIVAEAREKGDFGIYIGRSLGSATYNADRFLIAGFASATQVSYYALGFALVAPITVGAQTLGWVLFRSLARERAIPRSASQQVAVWLAVSAAICWFGIHIVVDSWLPEYRPLLGILVPALLTALTMGGIQLFNQFLCAQGQGRSVRNIALCFAGSNISLTLALVPPFGIRGAAWASLASAIVSLVGHVLAYRRTQRPGASLVVAR